MSSIKELIARFRFAAENPAALKNEYLKAGKKVVACFPYYVPEELITAAGMVPMGLWGCSGTPEKAKEYFPSFFCTIAQMGMEMILNDTLNGISAVVCPSMCDTLRPLTQNLKSAARYPVIFLAHPQNRVPAYGKKFCRFEYENMKKSLEEIGGAGISDEAIRDAIRIHNRDRKACREFVRLAGKHPELISAEDRCVVLKSRYFMLKDLHAGLLEELNSILAQSPEVQWNGTKIVLSGIIADNPEFLRILDQNHIAIAADDLAHESRSFRKDAAEDGDPMDALAAQFCSQEDDTILYDREIFNRSQYVAKLTGESGADGVVILMMTFCDPEEIEYPSLKQKLDEGNIPHIMLGYDQQMKQFGQASTALQAFSDMLALR